MDICNSILSHFDLSADIDTISLTYDERFIRRKKLISDNGCQPTSGAYMKACSQLKIKQIFTTWNNPKGNADTERVFRTLKEDLVWTHEWTLPFQFQQAGGRFLSPAEKAPFQIYQSVD